MNRADMAIPGREKISVPIWYEYLIEDFLRSSMFDAYRKKLEDLKKSINDEIASEIRREAERLAKGYSDVYMVPGPAEVRFHIRARSGLGEMKHIDMGNEPYPAVKGPVTILGGPCTASAWVNQDGGGTASMEIRAEKRSEWLYEVMGKLCFISRITSSNPSDRINRYAARGEFITYTGTPEEAEFTRNEIMKDIERRKTSLEKRIAMATAGIGGSGNIKYLLSDYQE